LAHDTFDVCLDFVIGGHEDIEAILLDDFEVLRGIDSALIEDT